MKLQYKTTGIMILLGIVILLFITIVYSNLNQQIVIQKELQNIENIAKEISHHMDTHIMADIITTVSFSSAPVIMDALRNSNKEFEELPPKEIRSKIDTLNNKWIEAEEIRDPFIQEYIKNPAAKFLGLQQINFPKMYGELFLTNRYGAMIASTGKLTTLAHAHKYWWKASYSNGKGRVFIDDRGFDTSVEGYVLGIVVPIIDKGEIIGIIKSNLNLDGPLTDVIDNYSSRHPGKIQIVRSNGLIVAEAGEVPLSNSLSEDIVKYLQTKEIGAEIIESNGKECLVSFSPIQSTLGSEKTGFGGKYESLDHIQGNEGEAWHIVVTLDKETAIHDAARMNKLLIIAELIFLAITSLLALFFARWIAGPLVKLSIIAKKIGEGDLHARAKITTKDEIGDLSQSVNSMAENLEKTLTSRDELVREIELRKAAEKEIKYQLKEKETILKEVHHRIKNNFASIVSLLSLQAQSTSTIEVQSALNDAIGRVDSMQVLYEKLLLSDNFQTTSVKEYLDNLITDIVNLFLDNIDIAVDKQIDDFQLDPKLLVPVGIIVNELLTNIMKYAFSDRTSGSIEIIVKENQKNIILIIQDNGKGLPEGFDLDIQEGFGLMLIRMLCEQLKGNFIIENKNGTRCTLEFPYER